MPYTSRPSDKCNPKTIDPFRAKGKKNKTIFASAYSNGGVPCRISHGSVKHKLSWSRQPQTLPYDPLLVTMAEGLRETDHPYSFVARTGFKEMCEAPGAAEKVIPLMTKLVGPLRSALSAPSSEAGVFLAGLEAFEQLCSVAGIYIMPLLKVLLPPMGKQALVTKFRERVYAALQHVESCAGPEAHPLIKAKIPTYTSIFM